MNKFTRIISKLSNLKEYGMNRDRLSKEERAYILLTTNVTMFQGVVNEYGSESKFAKAYGISNLIYSINNDLVRIYIPKESFSVDLRQLMKDLDASVVEYYGIVQFDGTEPEARGEYIFDPVIQMSDKVITDFKRNSFDNSNNNNPKENNDSSNKNDLEDEKEEKSKRKLYRLVKKSDKDLENDEQDNEESNDELEDNDSENKEELEDNEENSGENNNEDNSDELENGESSENDSEEQEDSDLDDDSIEDNSEDEEDLDSDEDKENTSDKNSRAYFMRGIKDPNEEDEEGVSDEDNSEDEEDPDSVDQFFDDEEVETNLDKKSDEIEKDLSRELDKRIEDEKAKKKEAKDKSKKFTKLKKKEKVKKESIEVSSIPSSRVANMDLLKSLASEPIEYSNSGFNDFGRIEKIIKKAMMTRDEYKRFRKKRGIYQNG